MKLAAFPPAPPVRAAAAVRRGALTALLCAGWLASGPLAAAPAGGDREARAYLAEGDPAGAAERYQEQVRINPFDPVALNNLAVARAAGGDYQTALELLQRAARLAPKRRDIAANLANLQHWLDHDRDRIAAPSASPLLAAPGAAVPPEPPPLWRAPAGDTATRAAARPPAAEARPPAPRTATTRREP